MNKIHFLLCLLGVCMVTAFSCDKDNAFTLEGSKWKLQSFYDSKGQKPDSPRPENCPECYVIKFEFKGVWQGHSSTNVLFGQYKVDTSKGTLKFTEINGTEINELYDGPKYMLILKTVHSFEVKNNQLKLFYDNEGNYLLFNTIP